MTESDVFQGFSVFSFPFLSTGIKASVPERRCNTQRNTFSISLGGDLRAFNVWKSFTLRPLKASLAFSTNGSAASRSLWTLSDSASTSTLILLHFSDSIFAIALCASTFSFSTPTIAACSSADFFFASTSTAITFRSSSSLATISPVSFSLRTPTSYFDFDYSSSSFFFPSIALKSLISSKNDFGVVYTYLLSCSKIIAENSFTVLNENGMNLVIESRTS